MTTPEMKPWAKYDRQLLDEFFERLDQRENERMERVEEMLKQLAYTWWWRWFGLSLIVSVALGLFIMMLR
jgi:hypothetical protein